MKFKIIRKTLLNDKDLEFTFEIIKNNMEKLGVQVTKQDYVIWTQNLKENLTNNQFYFYLLYCNEEIVGFIELIKYPDYLFLSEIQLDERVKQTRAILYILQYLFACQEFQKEEYLYFSILKINKMSNKTFSHLGGEIVEESKTKNRYKITRVKVENYLKRFDRDIKNKD